MPNVAWLGTPLGNVPRIGTVAWLTSLSDPANAGLIGLAPTPADWTDAGARVGVEQERFFTRRALLRHFAARRLGETTDAVVVRYDRDGRPTIAEPGGLFCSVAARRDLVGLALSSTPVGLDFEPLEPGPIPRPVLTDAEARHIQALSEAERLPRFLGLWTVKEAYVKAAGQGLSIDPATIDVTLSGGRSEIAAGDRRVPLAAVDHRQTMIGRTEVIVACLALAD